MPAPPVTDLVGTAEAATMLGTSVSTIHRLVRDDKLTPAVVAPGGYRGSYLFNRADVQRVKADRDGSGAA